MYQDDTLQRCSISADSQIENSGSEVSTDDETLDTRNNGYHDAENEVDQETDDDRDRVLSGKLSESSGSVASDLYDYKVLSLSLSLRHTHTVKIEFVSFLIRLVLCTICMLNSFLTFIWPKSYNVPHLDQAL